MKNSQYFKTAELLLRILPIIRRENNFALKGGTALNFFVRNLPRLSVDIDLAYLPVKSRTESLKAISESLAQIEMRILELIPGTRSQRKTVDGLIIGLIINNQTSTVKIEPNTIIRGSVYPPAEYSLCEQGKKIFELSVNVISLAKEELYAGKICAALDRQHPRDLFDIKLLLENEGITESMRKAFIVYLISHNRPISELLCPNFQDISVIFDQEFQGMIIGHIELDELLHTRHMLVQEINSTLTDSEKQFLFSFKSRNPNWELLGIPGIQNLPAVKWKLVNLNKMDLKQHSEALFKLEKILMGI